VGNSAVVSITVVGNSVVVSIIVVDKQ
jgi:hypothetical protein